MIVESEYNFAANLRRVRMSRGLTQTALGIAAEIPQNRISNWELGYNEPSFKDLRKLCAVLKCFPGDLLDIRSAELSVREFDMINGLRDLDDDGWFAMEATLEIQLKLHRKSDG